MRRLYNKKFLIASVFFAAVGRFVFEVVGKAEKRCFGVMFYHFYSPSLFLKEGRKTLFRGNFVFNREKHLNLRGSIKSMSAPSRCSVPRFGAKLQCSNLFFVESFFGSESVLSETTEQFAYVRRENHSENEVKVRCF